MKIHGWATLPHFHAHIAAIWEHLPDALKGWNVLDMSRRPQPPDSEPDDLIMVAAPRDFVDDRRMVYVEHGAGQRYVEYRNQRAALGYHGAEHPANVVAYISPRQDVADSWGRPAFAAGAPICDPYQLFGEPGVVAVTFHFDATAVCPEATSAFAHYTRDLERIIYRWRTQGMTVLGHHHPRFPQLAQRWKAWRIPVASADEVRRRASILIADNTSFAYEMAYLGRQVVSLNAPWYRRHVEHGMRFWSHVPGIAVDEPDELEALDMTNLKGAWRAETTEYVYGKAMNTGVDGLHAAAWLTALAGAF